MPKLFVSVRSAESKYGSVADGVIHPKRFVENMRKESEVMGVVH
ncbi:hypothetical protein [Rheinheimera sp. MM224]|nr:hypothetical protein [Rheinheimera sp. MM224]